MKKEYNFSEGERGKFYSPDDLKLNLPIYLEPETRSFIEKIAKKKKTDLSTVVNDLIKTDMQIAEFVK